MSRWLDAYASGIAAGEADRAAGRNALRFDRGGDRAERIAEFEALERALGATGAKTPFLLGYRAAQDPDEPANVPSPPWLRLALETAGAALDAYVRRTSSRRRYALVTLLVGVPLALATARVEQIASRRRAIRMGLRRRTDAPPPRIPLAQVAMAWAIAFAQRRDAKRRGAWPPSFATLAGTRFGLALEKERRWRSDLREWRASYQR